MKNKFVVNNGFLGMLNEIGALLGNIEFVCLKNYEYKNIDKKVIVNNVNNKIIYKIIINKDFQVGDLVKYIIDINNNLNLFEQSVIENFKSTLFIVISKLYKYNAKIQGLKNETKEELFIILKNQQYKQHHLKIVGKHIQDSKEMQIFNKYTKETIIQILTDIGEKIIIQNFFILLYKIASQNIYDNLDYNIGNSNFKKLKEIIGIDIYRKKINEAKENNNQNEVARIQLEAGNKICQTVGLFPYQYEENSFTPAYFITNRKTQCLGFSIICNTFLDKLSIKHSSMIYKGHINLVVYIGGKSYLCEPERSSNLIQVNITRPFNDNIKILSSLGTIGISDYGYEIDAKQGIAFCFLNNYEATLFRKMRLFDLIKRLGGSSVKKFLNAETNYYKKYKQLEYCIKNCGFNNHWSYYSYYKYELFSDSHLNMNNILTGILLNGPHLYKYYYEKHILFSKHDYVYLSELYLIVYKCLKDEYIVENTYNKAKKKLGFIIYDKKKNKSIVLDEKQNNVINLLNKGNYKKLVKLLIKIEKEYLL